MKKLLVYSIALLFLVSCNNTGPNLVETSVQVLGNCEKCKAIIEKSCALKGVSEAVWDMDSKLLKIKLDTTVISPRTVFEAVARAGYENDKFAADDYAYNALPSCCQYERRATESR